VAELTANEDRATVLVASVVQSLPFQYRRNPKETQGARR